MTSIPAAPWWQSAEPKDTTRIVCSLFGWTYFLYKQTSADSFTSFFYYFYFFLKIENLENVGWTITFIVRIYYINTCCSLVVKFSNSIKDSFTSRVDLLFSIIFKFWKLEYFYWNLRNCKNLLHQQLLPPGGGIIKLNYYEQMILTL